MGQTTIAGITALWPKNTLPLTIMGLMSGTSVDGVDACLAKLWVEGGHFRYDILATHSVDMPSELRSRLLTVMRDKHIALQEFCALNIAVAELFSETVLGLLSSHEIAPEKVDALGSHGQTIFHWPPVNGDPAFGKRGLGSTLQIGEPAVIAALTGIKTVADFRPADMAVGGQGAPLVCFADKILFEDAAIGRCIQNIGGIANVTVVPAQSSGRPMLAFDTGPGNMLIDAAMSHFYQQAFDADGAIARSGSVDEVMLVELMSYPYLKRQPPKTTGREDFGEAFFRETLLPKYPHVAPEDWLATLTQFTAISIAQAYDEFIFPRYAIQDVVLGGGGTRNGFLCERLDEAFAKLGHKVQIKTHADFGIPDQYKEALAFAILAWAACQGFPNNVPECTGAKSPVSLGKQLPGTRI